MNIRELNKLIITNNYSISMQFDIITLLKNCEHINFINDLIFFLQFLIVNKNRHKFFFVFYRDKKQFNVVVINFKNSSFYVQRVMNRQLRVFQDFCRVYIDDIMSFFKIFNDHVDHLRKLFSKMIKLRIILSVKKTFFNYFNITLLKQKIDVFDLSITKKRIVVVKTIRFFKNFKTLEIYFDLTNYQRDKMT